MDILPMGCHGKERIVGRTEMRKSLVHQFLSKEIIISNARVRMEVKIY